MPQSQVQMCQGKHVQFELSLPDIYDLLLLLFTLKQHVQLYNYLCSVSTCQKIINHQKSYSSNKSSCCGGRGGTLIQLIILVMRVPDRCYLIEWMVGEVFMFREIEHRLDSSSKLIEITPFSMYRHGKRRGHTDIICRKF